MTSKCGKNKEVAHEPQESVSLMLIYHILASSVVYYWTETHGNMESICFVQWSEKKKERYTYLSRTAWLFEDLC